MKKLIRKILKEEVSERLKKIIKNKLSKELSNVEIIFDDDESIWFIDRENKYWYLEFEKSGKLWWRYDFFDKFFEFFSMEKSEFEPIISEWVEDILNRKVISTRKLNTNNLLSVEDILNRKVISTVQVPYDLMEYVEYALKKTE
jgi:hypothetical protein